MSELSGPEAASLIRDVVDQRMSRSRFVAAWPGDSATDDDLGRARENTLWLFELRAKRERRMSRVWEQDLLDVADSLEAGRPIEWISVFPDWWRRLNIIAYGAGTLVAIVVLVAGWPKWLYIVAVALPFAVTQLALELWTRQQEQAEAS